MTQYTREELLSMNIQQLKPKNMAFNKFVESGSLMTNQNIEETHIRKDGTEIIMEIVANYISIDGNAYVLGTLRDITQKIKTRNELESTIRFLKDSETRFKILAENVPGTIYLCKNDEKFSMLYLNDTVGELTGFNKEEFLSNKLSFVELYHDKDKEMIFEKVNEALEKKEKFHLQYRLKHKSGNYIWVEEYGSGVYDGDKLLFLEGILIDVTTQINQAIELQQSKEDAEFNLKLYHSFIQNIQAGVVVHDPDTKVIFNNLLAEELLGLDAEQMRGKKASDSYWRFIYEDNSIIPLDEYPVNQVLKSKKTLVSMVLGVYRSENDLVWLLVNGTPIFNADNSIRMVIISFLDITEQKNSERLLHKTNREIEKNNRELKIAKEKAEESDRLKSAFLSNMSHEIQTPLNGMLGFLGLIDDPNLSEEMRKNYIETINASSNRLINTIDDIICISRIEAGAEIVQHLVTNPDKVITELIELYNPEAIEKDLELFFDNTNMNQKISIETDINKLKIILVNLIKNAIKFTDKGKIVVGYKIEKKKIVFYIKDTGRGINKDKLEFIFDRFRQGEIGLSRGYEGSGLGLSICKGYVDLLGGDIWVESEIGRGSTFFFSIGINDINIEVEENDNEYISEPVYPEKNNNTGNGEFILVVDDDNASFEFLKIVLEDSNFQVLHATNGLEAVSILENDNNIIAVLMDIKMPVMNGLDATKAIRKFNSEIPIIAQTAYGFSKEKKEAIDAGCSDYIAKPIKQDELIDKLARMIPKRR